MKITKEQAKKLYIKLGWEILEDKFRYYEGPKHGLKPISDEAYDKKETIYKKISKLLGLEPSACASVGFPHDRPCAKIIVEKLLSKKT